MLEIRDRLHNMSRREGSYVGIGVHVIGHIGKNGRLNINDN
jgi:hypothetical protein